MRSLRIFDVTTRVTIDNESEGEKFDRKSVWITSQVSIRKERLFLYLLFRGTITLFTVSEIARGKL